MWKIVSVSFKQDVVMLDEDLLEVYDGSWELDTYYNSRAEYKTGYYNDVSGVYFIWGGNQKTFVPNSNIKEVREALV